MKYLILITILFFTGCTNQTMIPSCIAENGTAYALVTPISLPMTGTHTTVECLR